jgi:hypothetical protein
MMILYILIALMFLLSFVLMIFGFIHLINPELSKRVYIASIEFNGNRVKQDAPIFKPFMQRVYGILIIASSIGLFICSTVFWNLAQDL